MNNPLPKGNSQIFMNFQEIRDHSMISIVRFYEANEEDISHLPLQEQVLLLNEYLGALFDLAKYEKYVHRCELLVYMSIDHNIKTFKGEDIYFKTLLKKAASLYHLHHTESAIKITHELLKMNHQDKASKYLMEQCLLRRNRSIIDISRVLVIIGFLVAAVIVASELFIIKPFYPEHEKMISLIRNSIFLVSILTFIGGEVLQRLIVRYNLYRGISVIVEEKASKQEI